MKERTQQILAALIQDFIENASPVASRKLLESGQFQVSSATVRNEFSLLEEVGLIESPHVSAGKVPTKKGYRYFVDELVENPTYKSKMKTVFEQRIMEYHFEQTKSSVFDALRLMASMSENIAFASIEGDRTLYIGLANMLRSPEFIKDPLQAARIAEVLEGALEFQAFLKNADLEVGKVKIFIGEDDLIKGLNSCSMLITPFSGKGARGFLGILGPMRMRYGVNKMILEYISQMAH